MKRGQRKRHLSQAMVFLILFGIVSMFSDMTHEGASSIRGAYLSIMGASAGAIGFFSGLGELIGYSMRYLFGKLTDKTRQYWLVTVIGYMLDVMAVPALALVGEHGWIWACLLLLIQRMGKAIKNASQRYDHVLCRIIRKERERALAFRSCWIRSVRSWDRCCCIW